MATFAGFCVCVCAIVVYIFGSLSSSKAQLLSIYVQCRNKRGMRPKMKCALSEKYCYELFIWVVLKARNTEMLSYAPWWGERECVYGYRITNKRCREILVYVVCCLLINYTKRKITSVLHDFKKRCFRFKIGDLHSFLGFYYLFCWLALSVNKTTLSLFGKRLTNCCRCLCHRLAPFHACLGWEDWIYFENSSSSVTKFYSWFQPIWLMFSCDERKA